MRAIILIFILFPIITHAQVEPEVSKTSTDSLLVALDSLSSPIDSIVIDTIVKKRNFLGRFFKNDYPNPKKAILLSFIIPGGGQLYNKQYWKLPIAYGTIAGAIIAIDYNNRQFKRYRDAFRIRRDEDPTTIDEFEGLLDDEAIRARRNGFDKNLDVSYIALGAAYIFNAADAFVSAHLKPFDVSEDLSLQLGPVASPASANFQTYGFGLTLRQKANSFEEEKIDFSLK